MVRLSNLETRLNVLTKKRREDWFTKDSYAFGDLYDLPESVTDDNFQFLHGVNVGEGQAAF